MGRWMHSLLWHASPYFPSQSNRARDVNYSFQWYEGGLISARYHHP